LIYIVFTAITQQSILNLVVNCDVLP